MVEVQMGVDDQMNVVVGEAMALQRVAQGRHPLHCKHGVELGILLIAETSIHQDVLAVSLDQQTVQVERNTIQLIRRAAFLPERLRHHPEHGATIQPEPAVGHCIDVKGSEFHNTTGSR